MAVARVTEIISASTSSIEDAVKEGVAPRIANADQCPVRVGQGYQDRGS